ncbi:hypothetical protein X551_00294 [Methylibium sp. T29]|nr:hypothetical protein X551_00294 [Methylibium sp. T29]
MWRAAHASRSRARARQRERSASHRDVEGRGRWRHLRRGGRTLRRHAHGGGTPHQGRRRPPEQDGRHRGSQHRGRGLRAALAPAPRIDPGGAGRLRAAGAVRPAPAPGCLERRDHAGCAADQGAQCAALARPVAVLHAVRDRRASLGNRPARGARLPRAGRQRAPRIRTARRGRDHRQVAPAVLHQHPAGRCTCGLLARAHRAGPGHRGERRLPSLDPRSCLFLSPAGLGFAINRMAKKGSAATCAVRSWRLIASFFAMPTCAT